MRKMRCVTIFIFFLAIITSAFGANNLSMSTVTSYTSETQAKSLSEMTAREKWLETDKMFKQAGNIIFKNALPLMMRASENLTISSQCTRSLLKMLSGIKKTKFWAIKMLDASGKIPSGILSGSLTAFGDYDECLEINVTNQFQGQYCLVDVGAPLPERRPFLPVDWRLPEFENFSKPDTLADQLIANAQHYYYLVIRSSVCIPSTCSKEDAQKIAEKVMEEIGIGWSISVPNCDISKAVPLNRSEIAIICVIGVIAFIAALGTAIDVIYALFSSNNSYQTNSSAIIRGLLCFSAYTNTKRLLKKDNSPDTIKIFHGIKVITVLWVILNHNYLYHNLQSGASLLKVRDMGKDIAFHVVLNGFLNVETFFFISAVLIVYARMKAKVTELNVFLYIFRRFWRLTPPFMFVIATTFLVPHLGSGPAWKETVGTMVDKCKRNWWTNLLYFNNYVPSSDQCLQWTWYIAVDTQLYILALLVLLPIKKRPRVGFAVIAAMFVTAIISVAITNVHFKLYATGLYIFPHPEDKDYFADHGYFGTHIHLATYCIGMSVGYFLATTQKFKISKIANVVGWLFAFGMAMLVLYGVYDWNQGNLPSVIVSTAYACTNKIVWSLALAWVTIMCFTGNGGIATKILSWRAFVPFSRLTYLAYLTHPVIQHMYTGSARFPINSDNRTFIMMYLGHVVAAFMTAFVFSLLFESPFMQLEKLMFPRHLQPKTTKETKGKEKNAFYQPSAYNNENGVYTINIRKLETNVP